MDKEDKQMYLVFGSLGILLVACFVLLIHVGSQEIAKHPVEVVAGKVVDVKFIQSGGFSSYRCTQITLDSGLMFTIYGFRSIQVGKTYTFTFNYDGFLEDYVCDSFR